jgi:hypothetical protein
MPEIHYQRLTRSGSRGGFVVVFRSRGSLWLGPDHLLSVETNGYTETYKRFYFRDIQAILIQQTKSYLWGNIVCGLLSLPFLIITLLAVMVAPKNASGWDGGTIGGVVFLGCIAGLFLLILVLNLFHGRTCKVFIRTAVQIEQLPSLNRVRKAGRVLSKIRPLIAAAQGGELSSEAAAAQIREWAASMTGAGPAEIVVDDPNAPPRLAS